MEAYLLVGLLLLLVLSGVHIAVCLGIVSMVAIYLTTQDVWISLSFLSSTAYQALRQYVYAVIPLFLLMGQFIARSGVASDLYWGIDRWLKRLPGRFAYATVLGNVVFAFVTGTSLASATTFTSIAYPQMKRAGYSPQFSLGLISGSACLGMLIPPSLLMIVWAILTDLSIGHLFIAGIGPGIVLAGLMIIYIALVAWLRPALVGQGVRPPTAATGAAAQPTAAQGPRDPSRFDMWVSVLGVLAIVIGAFGGIWVGFFTPTEGAGIGALISVMVGIAKGMRWPQIYETILSVGKIATPLLIILFTAQLYSRTLAMSGFGATLQGALMGSGLSEWGLILLMIVVWLLLGMLIDSVSIMLLTVPIFVPVAMAIGMDPLVFAIIGILTIEAGLLTPPFGLVVYAVRSVVTDAKLSMASIFLGALPFWIMLLVTIGIVLLAPWTVTGLTRLI